MSENEMYYTANPTSASAEFNFEAELLGNKLKFTSDAGVFSKHNVDFGSRFLIEKINVDEMPQGSLLDVGCGYGAIGLSLAQKYQREIELIDVNLRALHLAQLNAQQNGITNVKIYQSDLYQKVTEINFAGIISNPPVRAGKKVVHQIIVEAYDHLQVGGVLTIVLQKKQGAKSSQKKMLEIFGNAEIVAKSKGYYLLESIKNYKKSKSWINC